MKFSIRFADKIVGTLVLLALAILVVVIFMLGRNQRWFTRDLEYRAYFYSAAGLSTNMAIQYKGFTIGNVKSVSLAEDDSVEVIFSIYEEHNERVKYGSVVELQVSPIGLGNSFLFHPGKGKDLLLPGMTIPDVNSQQGRYLASIGLVDRPESSDSIGEIMNKVQFLLETINISLSGSEGAEELPLGQAMISLGNTMKNVEDLTSQIAAPRGTVMSALDGDGPLYTDITAMINSISGILDDVNRSTDVIPAHLPVMLNDINILLRQVQDVLTSVSNNPLLRGGMPVRVETGPGGSNPRDLEF